jgi:hypothetical protein
LSTSFTGPSRSVKVCTSNTAPKVIHTIASHWRATTQRCESYAIMCVTASFWRCVGFWMGDTLKSRIPKVLCCDSQLPSHLERHRFRVCNVPCWCGAHVLAGIARQMRRVGAPDPQQHKQERACKNRYCVVVINIHPRQQLRQFTFTARHIKEHCLVAKQTVPLVRYGLQGCLDTIACSCKCVHYN